MFAQAGDLQFLCIVVTLQPLDLALIVFEIRRLRCRDSGLAGFDDAVARLYVQVMAVDRVLGLPLTVLGVAQSVCRMFRKLPSLPDSIVLYPGQREPAQDDKDGGAEAVPEISVGSGVLQPCAPPLFPHGAKIHVARIERVNHRFQRRRAGARVATLGCKRGILRRRHPVRLLVPAQSRLHGHLLLL